MQIKPSKSSPSKPALASDPYTVEEYLLYPGDPVAYAVAPDRDPYPSPLANRLQLSSRSFLLLEELEQ